jgi:hypothetical protein
MSCSKTFVTLRLNHEDDLDPSLITSRLQITPTKSFRIGDPGIQGGPPHRLSGWSFSTEGFESLDIREHLDRLLDQLDPVGSALTELRGEGIRQDVFCYWATKDGQGGPQLDPSQMRRLSALELPIYFDVYRV